MTSWGFQGGNRVPSPGPGAGCLKQARALIASVTCEHLHMLSTARGPPSPVEVLPDLSHQWPCHDLHPHSFPCRLCSATGSKHIIVCKGAFTEISDRMILHEPLCHVYLLVTSPAQRGKRKQCLHDGQHVILMLEPGSQSLYGDGAGGEKRQPLQN